MVLSVTPSAKFIRHIVKVVRTAAGNNVYQIDGVVQPTLRFTEGDMSLKTVL